MSRVSGVGWWPAVKNAVSWTCLSKEVGRVGVALRDRFQNQKNKDEKVNTNLCNRQIALPR